MHRAFPIIAAVALSACAAAHRQPVASSATVLEGSHIDTGGAQPDDRGVPQPLWPGVPRVLVAQTVEEPPNPMEKPPSASRELCSPWWMAWLKEQEMKHPGTADLSRWVDVKQPPPAASDDWWVAWLTQERERCTEPEPEPTQVADWLGY